MPPRFFFAIGRDEKWGGRFAFRAATIILMKIRCVVEFCVLEKVAFTQNLM